jgi:dihydropyrimidinase
MTAKILFKSGSLVTDQETVEADLLVVGEKIDSIAPDMDIPDAHVVNVMGKLILPGGVDPHTHFDLPMFGTVSSDDHYTGHKAAAFGGTTTVMDFVPQEPDSIERSIQIWHDKASPKAAIDYGFHMNISYFDAKTAVEMTDLMDWGISTVKVFTAYNNRLRLSDGEIFQVMRKAEGSGLLTMLHAENGDIIELLTKEALEAGHTAPIWHAWTRPAWGAVESCLRGIALSQQTGAPLYLVHMNTAGGLDMLAYGRDRGIPVMGETCPQYLLFSEKHLQRPDGAKWVCSPPMRKIDDNEQLWRGLSENIIQVVGTDHCPFFYEGSHPIEYEGEKVAIPGKELGASDFTKIPNGLPGVGDRLPVLWTQGVGTGRITEHQFVAQTSTNPAKIFGLYPRKGALLPGSDADIVVWDPEKLVNYGIHYAQHRTDYNLYENMPLKGFPESVYLRGNLIVSEGIWKGKAGEGRFLKRKEGQII